MRDGDIYKGDILKVREWDNMVAEYGEGEHIIIPGECWFLSIMKHLCGKTFTVIDMRQTFEDCMQYYSLENVEERKDGHSWIITAGMLEPFGCEDDEFEVSDDEIKALLG